MTASPTTAPERALTARQARFVSEYLVDANATQAAVRAGYAPASAKVTASRLLARVNIAAAVAKGQAELAERNAVTTDEVIAKLREQYERATVRGQHAAAIRAAELLGRSVGMFADVRKHGAAEGAGVSFSVQLVCNHNERHDVIDLGPEPRLVEDCSQKGNGHAG